MTLKIITCPQWGARPPKQTLEFAEHEKKPPPQKRKTSE